MDKELKQLQKEVLEHVTKYIQLACEYFDIHIDDPDTLFNLKGSSLAGQANYKKWLVRFHNGYLIENKESYISTTVPHEVAHLVARKVYKHIKPHGTEWAFVMERVFEVPAKRLHSFKTPKSYVRKTRKFIYNCDCDILHKLSVIRHKRILKFGEGLYRCTKCKGSLTFKEESKD